MDREEFLESSYRAGGPLLYSIPAFFRGNIQHRKQTGFGISQVLDEEVRRVLEHYEIRYKDVSATGRISKVNPGLEPIPALVIITEKHSDSRNWYRASKEIYWGLAPRFPGISVELIDEVLLEPFRCFPVKRSNPIIFKWERICEAILRQLDIRELTALECWHYGIDPEPTGNPVTIVIRVMASPKSEFYTSTRRIQGILAQFRITHVDRK